MCLRSLRNALAAVLVLAAPAHAVTIAVGAETFLVETFPMPTVSDTTPLPLDLAIDKQTGNTVYMVPEFDKRIYSIARTASDGTTMTQIAIDAPASPLFRNNIAGADAGSTFSFQQERIDTTSDGSVWVSQGGNVFYRGTMNNWSRIMRRLPTGVWEAYTLPTDHSAAIGFFVDDPVNRLWVMAAGANALYQTRVRWWHEGETTATRYPPVDYRWQVARNFGIKLRFPAQLIQLKDGRLAGTLYFDNAFFLYDPDTLDYTRIALPAIPAGVKPPGDVLGSSGPWQIRQATDEALWIAEDYAKRVTKYNLFTGAMTSFDLTASLDSDEGVHSIAFDGTDAYVTSYPTAAGGNGRLIKITNAGTVTVGTSFATISNEGGLTGIVRDSGGKLWVAMFRKQRVLRLTRQ